MEFVNVTADDALMEEADIDYSQYDFPNVIWIRRDDWEVAVKVTCFVPIIAASMLGNGLILYLIATSHQLLPSSINLFIGNLATADFIAILLFPWMILCMDLFQNFILGSVVCQIEGFLRGKESRFFFVQQYHGLFCINHLQT